MPVTYRRATHADDFTTHAIAERALQDYGSRTGVMAITGGNDPQFIERLWQRRQGLWEHLTATSDQYWLAENEAGEAIGYARSILRQEHRELTEFFVLPENQSAGVGKELLRLAFPADTPQRTIIATTDYRAMARYLKAGVYPYATELYFERTPQVVPFTSDLTIAPAIAGEATIAALGRIDDFVLGFHRDVDHRFLLSDRTLYLYRRAGNVVGYGYLQKEYFGPFALLDDADYPAVLSHAESSAVALGADTVGFETPTLNTQAIDHFMRRGYHLQGFMGSILSAQPFGRLSHYILTSPPFFM